MIPEVICIDCGYQGIADVNTSSYCSCEACGGAVVYHGEDGFYNVLKQWRYNLTTYEKCEEILGWNIEGFDPSYIHDVMNKYAEFGKFTEGQETAVDNIYERWHPANKSASSNKEVIEQCEDLLEWADNNSWFDASMIESIYNQAEHKKPLTPKQIEAVGRLHKKFINQ